MNREFDPQYGNPYVGPRPFERGDQFFGRDREKIDLFNLLIGRRIVLLHSPSGAGKTSLIQAGLLPAVEEELVVLPTARVGLEVPGYTDQKSNSVNRYLLSAILSLEGKEKDLDKITNLAELSKMTLQEYISQRRAQFPPNEDQLGWLLIFDQFEEVLTLDPTDLEAKRQFFLQVADVLRDLQMYALFAMRDDYTGSMEPYFDLLPERMRHRYRLDLLTIDQALEASQGPADAGDIQVDFQDLAAGLLVRDLSRVNVQQPDGSVVRQRGPYIEPVQLSVVCQLLWNERLNEDEISVKDLKRLRRRVKAASGEIETLSIVDRALQSYYDQEVTRIADSIVSEREIRVWFDRQLILSQKLRNQVLKGIGQSQGLSNDLIQKLVSSHLVRAEQRRGLTWFELAHDRLVQPVVRSNQKWFSHPENMLAFQRQAEQWNVQGRPSRLLLNTTELRDALAMASRSPERISGLDRDYLQASQDALRPMDPKEAERQLRFAERGLNLADIGWGVIFSAEMPPSEVELLRSALKELLDLRKEQAGEKRPEFYQEFDRFRGYRRGESARDFLTRHGATTGVNTPDKVPYYLLLVGSPEQIPFDFQYGLDERFAVGRLYFGKQQHGEEVHDLEAYARYARSVVTSEKGILDPENQTIIQWSLPKKLALFSPNLGDNASIMTMEKLMTPLTARLQNFSTEWQIDPYTAEKATQDSLKSSLGGANTPALLFTVSHSLPPQYTQILTEPQNRNLTGALVTQEAAEEFGSTGQLSPENIQAKIFSAEDVDEQARVIGLMGFILTGYSVGTPETSEYDHALGLKPKEKQRANLSKLPQRLLSHPLGGALAVIGHVDEMYLTSFLTESSDSDIEAIARTLERLMDGHTAGSAMEALNQRFSLFYNLLAENLVAQRFNLGSADASSDTTRRKTPEVDVQMLFTRTIDARNYILVGDPAVRLPIEGGEILAERPTIEPVEGFVSQEIPVDLEPDTSLPQPEELPETSGAEPEEEFDTLYLNGIRVTDSQYLAVLNLIDVAQVARREKFNPETLRFLKAWYEAQSRRAF